MFRILLKHVRGKMLDQQELIILSHLRENSRKSLSRISKDTRIPVSTLFDKIRKYESGAIKRHTTLVDFKELGYDVKVNVMIKLGDGDKDCFERFLSTAESVNSAYGVGVEYDYMLECVFKDVEGWQYFMKRLLEFDIVDKKEFFVTKDLKKEAFLTNTNLVRMDQNGYEKI